MTTYAGATQTSGAMSTKQFIWRLLRYRPGFYLGLVILRAVIFAGTFQASALLIRAFFDTLTDERSLVLFGSELSIYVLSALFVGVAVFRAGLSIVDVFADVVYRFTIGTLMRRNLFARILDRSGSKTLPTTTGDAISRFQGDVEGIVNFVMRFPHLIGMGLFSITSVIVMLSIHTMITVLAFIPMLVIISIANVAMRRVQKYRSEVRVATGKSSGFLGEMFGAVQAIKVNSAESRMLDHFDKLNETRRQTSLKDGLFGAILNSVFENIVNISTGLILVLAGQAIRTGMGDIDAFTVGDLALFVYYLGFVTGFTSQVGELSAEYQRADVNKQRIQALLQTDSPAHIVTSNPIHLRGDLPNLPQPTKTAQHQLKTLEVRNLTYNHSDANVGVNDVSFKLHHGTLTVITGRIGAGKTTLLRVLLGLLPKASGDILWNGKLVAEPNTFFTPPRCAYTPQTPVLFSESVRDNILLGLEGDSADLSTAIQMAVMEQDIAALQNGLDTKIGNRGMRLSGGQAQRTAAARMFVRDPALLVFDDLSSALDVETERTLWQRLLAHKDRTSLAISHRRSVLELADNIILLKDGRVEAVGDLEELLETSEEMQALVQSELEQEIDELIA